MKHRRKNHCSILFLSALMAVITMCGCGGSSTSSPPDSRVWVTVASASSSLSPTLWLNGTAWVSDEWYALHCAGIACLFDQSYDNYPGVNVTCVNLTTGAQGSVTSYYGGGTDWKHLWSATVPVISGLNSIQVSAYDPSGLGGSTTFTYYAAPLTSIKVTPADARIPRGTSQQFTATGTRADATTLDMTGQVTWTSLDTSKVTINAAGYATGWADGAATITAAWGGMSGLATLTVVPAQLASLAISPTNATIPAGHAPYPFTAQGTFDDGMTKDVTATTFWTSSDTSVATISNDAGSPGVAAAGMAGTTLISASSGSVTSSTPLTVESFASIAVSGTAKRLLKGASTQLSAVGTLPVGSTWDITSRATWSSSDPSIAEVSNAQGSGGRVTAVSAGTATMTASWGTVSGQFGISVSPWTRQTSGTTEFLFDVAWSGTRFTAVRSVDSNIVSPDGVAWSPLSFDPVARNTLYGDCSCGPRFAAVGMYVFLSSSNDGASFSTTSTPNTEWYAVTCSDTKFVAVGSAGAIMSSDAGQVSSGTTVQLYGITWSGSKFVAVGYDGTVLSSADGISWATVQTAGGTLRGVTWSGTQFVAVGDGGIVQTSPDGVVWTVRASGTGNRLFAVTWTGTRFVAVGEWLTIITSPDGVAWTDESVDGREMLHGAASSGTTVVAVGQDGMILTRP